MCLAAINAQYTSDNPDKPADFEGQRRLACAFAYYQCLVKQEAELSLV